MATCESVNRPVDGGELGEGDRVRPPTKGSDGSASDEASLSVKYLVVSGKRGTEAPIGSDERTRVLDTHLNPWRRICALRIHRVAGEPNSSGPPATGWFVGPRTIITAGHCVYNRDQLGGWASHVSVTPGRNGPDAPFGTINSSKLSTLSCWIDDGSPDFDIGCIHLDQDVGATVGAFKIAALSTADLLGYMVNIAGYPSCVLSGPGASCSGLGNEMFHHRNHITAVNERRIFYDVDTSGGQSGSPVWLQENNTAPPLVVGIHAYGNLATPGSLGIEANSATRITAEMYDIIADWISNDGDFPDQ